MRASSEGAPTRHVGEGNRRPPSASNVLGFGCLGRLLPRQLRHRLFSFAMTSDALGPVKVYCDDGKQLYREKTPQVRMQTRGTAASVGYFSAVTKPSPSRKKSSDRDNG